MLRGSGKHMSYLNKLIIPGIVKQVEDQSEKNELNFENKDSIEHRELAYQDLESEKSLAKVSKETNKEQRRTKKALNRKVKQIAMEATEHAQKAVIFADDKNIKISNMDTRGKLKKTHNNNFMQREQEKAGINILQNEDIKKLNSAVRKKNGEKSPYNAIRFSDQEIDDKSVGEAIEIAQKAVDNLEVLVEESKKLKIKFGDIEISIDI